MAEFPALPWWTDAYLADTTHLTTVEHGAYLLLLATAWRTPGCRLPDEDKKLARFARLTTGQWTRMKPTIMEFWTAQDGHLYQGRLTDEYDAVRQLSQSQSRKGKARWLKRNKTHDAAASPGLSPADASPTPTPTPTPIVEERSSNEDPKKNTISDPIFDEFWEAYPRQRRGSKQKTLLAWKTATARASPGEIVAGLADYARSNEVRDGFAKGAAAWLNDDRWTSDYRTHRNQTAEEQLDEWMNEPEGDDHGHKGNDHGPDIIDGEFMELSGEGSQGNGRSLPPGPAGSLGRAGESRGDCPGKRVGQDHGAEASGYLDDSEHVQDRIAHLAKVAAKKAKP